LSVADPDGVEGGGVELIELDSPCLFDAVLGLPEQIGQVVRPSLVPADADGQQLAEVVGVMRNSA
jgi:hypothetical protein